MIAGWAMIVSLAESQQHFWEELIGDAALGGQSIAPLAKPSPPNAPDL